MRRVVLLTDFGTADGYAAAMAAVVAAAAPDALVEHASHDIDPGDIFGAALALSRYAARYPRGTVHLVVVDPGVGTTRRALAAEADGRLYVAPDNGVLSLVLAEAGATRIIGIRDDDAASATFHGRDVFAPAAARLAAGEALERMGDPLADPVRLPIPTPERRDRGVEGEVIHADRFGNLITNIPAELVEGARDVRVEGTAVGPPRRTYGDVPEGAPVALIGSIGMLKVSVRNGSAAARFSAGRGARVRVELGE